MLKPPDEADEVDVTGITAFAAGVFAGFQSVLSTLSGVGSGADAGGTTIVIVALSVLPSNLP